jgi:hypothetical protein
MSGQPEPRRRSGPAILTSVRPPGNQDNHGTQIAAVDTDSPTDPAFTVDGLTLATTRFAGRV